MLVKSIEVECRNPLIRNRARQSPIYAYMDSWLLLDFTGLRKDNGLGKNEVKIDKIKVTGIEENW